MTKILANFIKTCAIAGLLTFPVMANAFVNVPTVDWTAPNNSRDQGSGLTYSPGNGGEWTGPLTWNITQNGSLYTYTFNFANNISDFYLQINPLVTSSNFTNYITSISVPGTTFTSTVSTLTVNSSNVDVFHISSPNLDISSISFTAYLDPVWGSVYLEEAANQQSDSSFTQGVSQDSSIATNALNVGWGTVYTNQSITNYVPSLGVITPEPSAYILIASGLIGCIFVKARKSKLQNL